MLGMYSRLRLMRCCRSWLRKARLGITAADEAASLLQNPLRNGVLLCDLAGDARIVADAYTARANFCVLHHISLSILQLIAVLRSQATNQPDSCDWLTCIF